MSCYKSGGCGVYEMRSCDECPASKPEYLTIHTSNKPVKIATMICSVPWERIYESKYFIVDRNTSADRYRIYWEDLDRILAREIQFSEEEKMDMLVRLESCKEWIDKQGKELAALEEEKGYPVRTTGFCGIVTDTREEAIEFIKKHFNEIEDYHIAEKSVKAIFKDGNVWYWMNWVEPHCGVRFFKVAVSKNISESLFEQIVLPCCATYCRAMEVI